MSISPTHWSTALLAALVALTGCTDRDPTGPSAAQGESVALASARKPVRVEFNETFSNEFACGTYAVVIRAQIIGHETTLFNQAGDAVLLRFHFRYRGTITNSVSGKTLTDNAAYNGTLDLLTGAQVVNGFIYNVKDRENGIRIKDIGRIVFDAEGNITFQAGRHDVDGFGNAGPLYCAAVA